MPIVMIMRHCVRAFRSQQPHIIWCCSHWCSTHSNTLRVCMTWGRACLIYIHSMTPQPPMNPSVRPRVAIITNVLTVYDIWFFPSLLPCEQALHAPKRNGAHLSLSLCCVLPHATERLFRSSVRRTWATVMQLNRCCCRVNLRAYNNNNNMDYISCRQKGYRHAPHGERTWPLPGVLRMLSAHTHHTRGRGQRRYKRVWHGTTTQPSDNQTIWSMVAYDVQICARFGFFVFKHWRKALVSCSFTTTKLHRTIMRCVCMSLSCVVRCCVKQCNHFIICFVQTRYAAQYIYIYFRNNKIC